MTRRKRTDAHSDDAPPTVANGHVSVLEPPAPEESSGPPAEPQAEPKKRPPAISFAANSDRTTRIEVSVWGRVVTVSPTEEYTQYSITVTRSWRDKEGKWTVNGFYRIHDIPVMQMLLAQAYTWAVGKRMDVRTEGDETIPF